MASAEAAHDAALDDASASNEAARAVAAGAFRSARVHADSIRESYLAAEARAASAAARAEAAINAANDADRDYFDLVQSLACM